MVEKNKSADLAEECTYIFKNMFQIPAPLTPEILNEYCTFFSRAAESANDQQIIHKILSKNLDSDAIEFFLRLKSGNNPVTRRYKVISYLAEMDSNFFSNFFQANKNSNVTLELFLWGIRTLYLFCKGLVLVKVYRLG